jgi:hypothetical protein
MEAFVRTFITVVVLLLILIIGGGLTSMLIANNGSVLPILTTTNVPDASPTTVLPWKAEQFFLLVGFILFNLIGIAATLALIFWLVDRGLRRNRGSAQTPAANNTVARAEE